MTNEFVFKSSNTISVIHAKEWIPDTEPIAVLQIAHGMQEYIKNYERFAEYMRSKGYYVVMMDFIGHGHSTHKSDLGYFPDADSTEFLLLDMRYLTERTRSKLPKKPYIMFGHSFGSFLTRIYISRYRDVDGAIIMGGGVVDEDATRGYIDTIRKYRRTKSSHYRSKLLQISAFGKKLRKFLPLKNSIEWTTRDAQKEKEYLDDERNNYIFTLNGFQTLFLSTLKAQDESVIANTPPSLPVLIISGENDAIGDYGKGTRKLYHDMYEGGMSRVTLKLYEDARHNLLQDVCYNEVHEDIDDWCMRNIIKKKY